MHLLLAGIFYLFTSSSSTDNQTTCSLVSDADTTIPFSREAPMYHFDTLKGKPLLLIFMQNMILRNWKSYLLLTGLTKV